MGVSNEDIASILNITRPLVGQAAWRVKLGKATYIDFDFGRVITSGKNVGYGEWHLLVLNCSWRVDSLDGTFVADGDEPDKQEAELKRLENMIITDIEITRPALETTFRFEGGLTLHLFPTYTNEKKHLHWSLFTPDKTVLRVGPGTSWSLAERE